MAQTATALNRDAAAYVQRLRAAYTSPDGAAHDVERGAARGAEVAYTRTVEVPLAGAQAGSHAAAQRQPVIEGDGAASGERGIERVAQRHAVERASDQNGAVESKQSGILDRAAQREIAKAALRQRPAVEIEDYAPAHRRCAAAAVVGIGRQGQVELAGSAANSRIKVDIITCNQRQGRARDACFRDCRRHCDVVGCRERNVGSVKQSGQRRRSYQAVRAGKVERSAVQIGRADDVVARRCIAVDVGRGAHGNVGRVEQQAALPAQGRPGIDRRAKIQMAFAGNLYKTAIATTRAAARRNFAVSARSIIGPHDDLAALAGCNGVRAQHDVSADKCRVCVLNVGIFSLIVAAHQDRAAADASGNIDQRSAN